MNKPLKLIPIGNSTGVILPKDVLARLHVAQGDAVSISDTPGGIELRPYEPDFEEQMAVARRVMERRRLALRELAK
jgi:putative addiction module antidote